MTFLIIYGALWFFVPIMIIVGIAFAISSANRPKYPEGFRQQDDDPRFVWRCRHCNTKINKTDIQCPNCGKMNFERLTFEQYQKAIKNKRVEKVLIVIAIVMWAVVIGVYMYIDYQDNKATAQMQQQQELLRQQEEQLQAAIPEHYITLEAYGKIAAGMTYGDVVELAGFDGVSMGKNEDGTQTMNWNGIAQDSYVSVIFKNGIVASKSSHGFSEIADLPDSNGPEITLEEFKRIGEGMTYQEVCNIIGSEGELQSSATVAGVTTAMYSWSGGNEFSSASVMFTDGKVISRSQYGLE